VSPPGLVEEQLLRPEELAAGIRLACQTLALGSLQVEIPPESAAVAQRLQVGGDEHCARFDPPTEVRDVELPPPPAATPQSDWEILIRRLDLEELRPNPGLGFLRRLGAALADDRTVRLGLRRGAPSWALPAWPAAPGAGGGPGHHQGGGLPRGHGRRRGADLRRRDQSADRLLARTSFRGSPP